MDKSENQIPIESRLKHQLHIKSFEPIIRAPGDDITPPKTAVPNPYIPIYNANTGAH